MLRSLVGSEMCIRDSINIEGWATPTGTPWPAFPQVPIPGSNIMSLPTIETSFKIEGPSPVSYTHLTLPTIYAV